MTVATSKAVEVKPEIQLAKVGKPAPDFDLPSTKNLETLSENVKLSDYKGKWLILLFYPLDFTFVCPTELTAFSDRIEELNAVGAEVLGISTDSVFSHRAWLRTPRDQNGIEGLKFPLASDVGGRLAAKYNILVEEKMVALRGLFIIDPEGILRYAVVHDLNIGRSVDETLRVLQALQTGGLCGADWRPGQETLKV
ncbi:MAG: peroxiredoxin [Acidobacteria bacterium]|jgi:peroxiredoxin (alkyl hydroperoxide reductase subunit C)|nr:MAG: peroxiredoxin [Acidobacteriota bacterium]